MHLCRITFSEPDLLRKTLRTYVSIMENLEHQLKGAYILK